MVRDSQSGRSNGLGGLERARVRRHLRRAEAHARTAPQTGLTHVQRTVRSLLLRELERYRKAGRFFP